MSSQPVVRSKPVTSNGSNRPTSIAVQQSTLVGNSRPGYAKPVLSLAPNAPPNTPNPDIVISSPSPQDKIHSSHVATDSESQGISSLEAIDKAFSSIIIEHEESEEPKPIEVTEIATSQIVSDDSGGITNQGYVAETVSSKVVVSSQTEITSDSKLETNDEEAANEEEDNEKTVISTEIIGTSSTSTKTESITSVLVTSSSSTQTTLSQSATSGPISAEECELISSEIASHFAQKDAADKHEKIKSPVITEPEKTKTTLVVSSSEPSTVETIEIQNESTHIVTTSSEKHGITNPAFVDDEILVKIETTPSEPESEVVVEKRVDFDVVNENRASKVLSLHPTKRSSDATSTFDSFKDFIGGIMTSAIKAISPSSDVPEPQFEAKEKESSDEESDESNSHETDAPVEAKINDKVEAKAETKVDSIEVESVKSNSIEKEVTVEVKTFEERTAEQNAATENVNDVDSTVVTTVFENGVHEPKIIDDISQLKSSKETTTQILSNSSSNFGLSSPALIREILSSKTEVAPSKSDDESDFVSSTVMTDSITFVNVSDPGLHGEVGVESSTIEVISSEPQIDYDDEATVSTTVIKKSGPIIVEVSTSDFDSNVTSSKLRSEFTSIETTTTSSSTYYEVKTSSHETVINGSSHGPVISEVQAIPSVNKKIDYSSFDVD